VLDGDHGLLLFAVACRGIRANGPIENAGPRTWARAPFSRSEHGTDAKLISRRDMKWWATRTASGGVRRCGAGGITALNMIELWRLTGH
jgi:hypothetical protein